MKKMDDELEVTVDGISYKVSELSDEAQQQVNSLQYVEAQITDLNAKLAVYQTARNAYQAALQQLVPRARQ
jgi:methyl-accepting chemotaxis protein